MEEGRGDITANSAILSFFLKNRLVQAKQPVFAQCAGVFEVLKFTMHLTESPDLWSGMKARNVSRVCVNYGYLSFPQVKRVGNPS
ncbi:hypothetical protein BMS3Bbin06_00006 [bacterium BMS3Bbin06]|nr:hypothetical protein BMS3Abin08_01002 [bacterium BMS3Abin08]GBE33499.1 hypothetical protein BMS3Bbin06_00006 [bacterium BMS3Bbin06]